MHINKIITISIVALLPIAGLSMILSQQENEHTISVIDKIESTKNESINYNNHVEFNQDSLQLQREVVQFEITFHQDDIIDVSKYMYVYYVDETIKSVYCLLTDGEKPLLDIPGGVFYVPFRKYSLITPRMRFSFGKLWLFKLLNDREGRIGIGSPMSVSGQFNVRAGDTWYLTLAVLTSSGKSGYSIVFDSLNKSMEVNQLVRHEKVGFYSANYNQFSGKYYAIKLSWLGGLCICDVFKEITTSNGSIVDIYVAGHRKGNMMVHLPNGENMQFSKRGSMHYSYWGNESGTWLVTVKGRSIYFIMDVVLLYIDIDPHLKAQNLGSYLVSSE